MLRDTSLSLSNIARSEKESFSSYIGKKGWYLMVITSSWKWLSDEKDAVTYAMVYYEI